MHMVLFVKSAYTRLHNEILSLGEKMIISVLINCMTMVMSTTRVGKKRKSMQESPDQLQAKRLCLSFLSQRSSDTDMTSNSPSAVVSLLVCNIIHNPIVLQYIHFYVTIGYKKSKSYILAPSSNCLGKSLARGSKCALVSVCFKDIIILHTKSCKYGTP